MSCPRCIKRIGLLLVLLILLPGRAQAHCRTDEAADVTGKLTLETRMSDEQRDCILDNSVTTYSEFCRSLPLTFRWEAPRRVQGVYLEWYALPEAGYTLSACDAAGETVFFERFTDVYLNRFHPLPEDAASFTVAAEGTCRLSTLHAYAPGTLPDGVLNWDAPATNAHLMVVGAHPDDEYVFFGGTIPYALDRGLTVSMVYMTGSARHRRNEALDGLRLCGVREYPVFGPFRDKFSKKPSEVYDLWGSGSVLKFLVAEFRRAKPLVVVTHDLAGEYGHGAHIVTARTALEAVRLAADPAVYPESAEEYGVWQVQKLYLHLFSDDVCEMDWDVPLDLYRGRSARQVAKAAFARHKSQAERTDYHIYGRHERYNSALFGLAFSTVGPDTAHDDFFEHIDPALLPGAPAPAPTPAPGWLDYAGLVPPA